MKLAAANYVMPTSISCRLFSLHRSNHSIFLLTDVLSSDRSMTNEGTRCRRLRRRENALRVREEKKKKPRP